MFNINKKLAQKPISIAQWGLDNRMYESTHKNSRFKGLYSSPESFNNNLYIAYHTKNKEPVSVVIFECYAPNNILNENPTFQSRGKKYTYGCMGRVGIYVKPEYRGLGLADNLMKSISENIIDLCDEYSHDFLFIAANSKANAIVSSYFSTKSTQSTKNSHVWRSQSKALAGMGYTNNHILKQR